MQVSKAEADSHDTVYADDRAPSGEEGQQLSIPTHAVQFYEHDAFLIESVSAFVKEGMDAQDHVVVFTTPQHRQLLEHALHDEDEGTANSGGEAGNVLYYDAEDTIAKFTVEGWPEESLFMSVVGKILEPLSEGRPIRVFGEMVALLWAQHQYRAALRLEELWNALIVQQPVSLLCAYSITGFHGKEAHDSYLRVCGLHSHVHSSHDKAA